MMYISLDRVAYIVYDRTKCSFYIHLYSPIYMVAKIRKTATTTTERKEEKKPYYCTND